MKRKKIRVFLGGYVNTINAQNLNCRSLALHLDRNRFDIGVMTYPGGQLEMGSEFDGVKKFRLLTPLYRPLRFVRQINYLRGLLWCDVAYLPKGEIYRFCQRIARLLGKKTFITVEGVIDKESYQGLLAFCGSDAEIRKFYNGYDWTYSITKYMSRENDSLLSIKSHGVLYLGVDADKFLNRERKAKSALTDLIFIGNDLKRKRVDEFISLATRFSNIQFHVVGGTSEYFGTTAETSLPNLTFHGRLPHEQLSKLLAGMDLHVFTSRSEGFPKVTLETAAAGVPSIVYSDYGASEWITTGKDGYVVDTYDEIVAIISDLQQHPEKLAALSANAVALARRFDWARLVKDWETVIETIALEDSAKA